MSDENSEQEQKSAVSHHELSETPFGGGRTDVKTKVEATEPEPTEPESVEEAPAEQPEAQAEQPEVQSEQPEVEAKQPEVEAKQPEVEAGQPEVEAEQPDVQADQPTEADEAMLSEVVAAEPDQSGVDYGKTFRSLTEGDVVDGVVVHVDREGVLVDVGTKSEGTVKPSELSREPGLNPEDVVAVGDKIRVYVIQTDSQDGGPVLSKKRADFENAWERVEKAAQTGEVLKAMVTDRVKGGLVADLGIRGFVPASHVGSGKIKNLERFVGQSMAFKVIEVDRERRKVVLSNRLAAEEERRQMRKETLASLVEGQVRNGVVRRITDYGAFVDLGGVDGLLHVSEMSWTRISHPTEAVKVGQKIQVMILKLNLEQGRVSLGLRQILPDPWIEIRQLHSVGDVIHGTVTRLVPFGAFVQVEGGVEGIIPNAELATRRVSKPEEVVSIGQDVEVKVIDLRPDERRMTLSLRQLQSQQEREREESELRTYAQTRPEGRTTIGDLIGDQLGDLASAVTSGKPTRRKSRSKSARRAALEEAEALAEAGDLTLEEPVVEEPKAERADAEVAEPEAAEELAEEPAGVAKELTIEVPEAAEAAEQTEESTAEPEAEQVAEPSAEVVKEESAEAAAAVGEVEAVEVAEQAEEPAEKPKPKRAAKAKSEKTAKAEAGKKKSPARRKK